ncbi:MAG: aspartate/glutamate/glutamine transport system permease protein [Solirubrobacteraceae bacterium]|nr:aspartate/glutamate/glutamine transport system permease protein [Solirubrobacteraceae bacterium]
MRYLFDPHNWEWFVTGSNARFLLEGFLVNVQIAVIAMVFSLLFGLALALARISRFKPLSIAVGLWIDVWRNLPLVLMILYLAIALPKSWRDAYEQAAPDFLPDALQTGRVFAALLALVLYNAAVMGEIMRAGIQSLDRGQGEAATALGMTYWQRMRIVILPQGLRRMVPATVSQLITLNKDTTLVSIIGIQDVMRHARIVTSSSVFGSGIAAPYLQVLIVVATMFVLTNLALSRFSRRLELRQRERTGTTVKPVSGLEDQVAAVAGPR